MADAHSDSPQALLARSRVRQQQGDFASMLELARRALALDPQNVESRLRLAECLLYDGDAAQALVALAELEDAGSDDHLLLQRIAEMYLLCGQHEHAARCYQRSLAREPDNPRYVYNLASSQIALGAIDEAEALLTRVIELDPQDYDAWQNRSTLRTQTPERNHVAELESSRARLPSTHPGQVPLCYALAKELEDLGRFEDSFRYLQQGAVQRRRRLQYDVHEDVEAMALIARAFDRERLRRPHAHHETTRPIFVLGLPRSGTTLVDRILSSHSRVESVGELNALAFSVIRAVGGAEDKRTLIERSADSDFTEIGSHYCKALGGYGHAAPHLVDKTPLHFLYIGLIHLAMPGAKIIHLRRQPLDSCYAMYKTLFRMGYPFTYSLQDIGRYYIAYRGLMEHWRRCLPGAVLDVDYERLVTDQTSETRRVLEHCGLDWEDACLDFHRHSGAAATASAAQVRQPLYTSSVGRWRRYATQLAPLAARLAEHGIAVD